MSERIEIQFTILSDGEEIGFGACIEADVDAALYAVQSVIQNREWETTQPEVGTGGGS